jgi:hypothetical protein
VDAPFRKPPKPTARHAVARRFHGTDGASLTVKTPYRPPRLGGMLLSFGADRER